MTRSKAFVIFDDINNDDFTDQEKAVAVNIVMNMVTHNGTTKESMVAVIKWLWNHAWEFEEPFKTPENPEQCTFRLSKVKDGTGDAERGADWCNGYQASEDNDEPCRICQGCKLCAANDPDDLDKAQEA